MASSDEENKRRYLANLAAMGTDLAFKSEMASNPEIMRDIAPNEYLRSIDQATAFDDMSQNSLQRARALANTQVQQEPIQNNFFTQRGDNKALNLLRGVVGSRLISRGLLEDPTAIAKRNLYARQARTAQIANLGNEAQNIQDLANQTRAQAFARAQQAGVNVDPRLALSAKEQVTNAITTQGLGLDPQERLSLSLDADKVLQAGEVDKMARQSFVNGSISQAQMNQVLSAQNDNKLETYQDLIITKDLGGGLKERVTLAGEVIDQPNQDTRVLMERYGFAATGADITSRKEINKSLIDINSPANQARRAENTQRFEAIVPALTEAVLLGTQTISGPIFGSLPQTARNIIDPIGQNIESLAGAIAQQSLRETLGGQFAVQENIQLQQRFYDIKLPPIYNLARIRRSQKINALLGREIDRLQDHIQEYGFLENGPKVDGKVQGFKRKKMTEILNELGGGDDGLDNLLDEFNDDELLRFAASNADKEQVFNGKTIDQSLVERLKEIKRQKIAAGEV